MFVERLVLNEIVVIVIRQGFAEIVVVFVTTS